MYSTVCGQGEGSKVEDGQNWPSDMEVPTQHQEKTANELAKIKQILYLNGYRTWSVWSVCWPFRRRTSNLCECSESGITPVHLFCMCVEITGINSNSVPGWVKCWIVVS